MYSFVSDSFQSTFMLARSSFFFNFLNLIHFLIIASITNTICFWTLSWYLATSLNSLMNSVAHLGISNLSPRQLFPDSQALPLLRIFSLMPPEFSGLQRSFPRVHVATWLLGQEQRVTTLVTKDGWCALQGPWRDQGLRVSPGPARSEPSFPGHPGRGTLMRKQQRDATRMPEAKMRA